ncbi:MAG: radical SAM protein, partial [Kiritimatiellia bacterium]|nr:radical SAM protein [Kiritimatiellia bacterium]
MRVLLLSMPDTMPLLMHQNALHLPNLGIASLGANLDAPHEVWIADLLRKRIGLRRYLLRTLRRLKPDLVGLSAMSWQFGTCLKIARLIRMHAPETRIVLGGYHATLMAEEIAGSAEAPLFDFIIRGEGEEPLRRLANALDGADPLDQIPSLSYRENGVFRHNPAGELIDLSKLRLPIRDRRRLTFGYHINMHRIETLETSRGCTHTCNFCSIRHMYGRSFRMFPIERVLQDIDDIYFRRKTRWIFITDDNIVLNPPRLMELCDAIVARKYRGLNFFVQADVKTMARYPDMVRKMGQAGFRSVFLGIENVSRANLELMKKGNVVESTRRAVQNCHENGIAVIGGLIFGLPNDDEQSIIENYRFLKEIEADGAYCQIITPYPKTGMREELLQSGLVTNPDDFQRYDGIWANVRTRHLDQDRLQFLFWYHRQKILGMWKPT